MSETTSDAIIKNALKSGGPAHPVIIDLPDGGQFFAHGLTLRDWFAGQAMQARLTGTALPRLDIRHAIAADAYAIADAMLAAREVSP